MMIYQTQIILNYLYYDLIQIHNLQKNENYIFDHMYHKFFHLYGKSNDEIVKLSRDLKIDIAIDLNGYTTSNRYEIFVKRCSPIQISFLGYPGTMGSKFIDYIISDRTIISESLKKKYSENEINNIVDKRIINFLNVLLCRTQKNRARTWKFHRKNHQSIIIDFNN